MSGIGRVQRRDPPGGLGHQRRHALWAGVIPLADQQAGRHLGYVNPAIYAIARGPAYHKAFHDITTGGNTFLFTPTTITGYPAGPGWDPVTGWGTPNVENLVPLLASYTA